MSCCCFSDYDNTAVITGRRDIKRARKAHTCCECGRTIPRGAPYRYETSLYDGRWDTHHTCTLCATIRDDRFSCGWTWGELWGDLHDCLRDFNDDDDTGWLDPPTHPIEAR